MGQGRARRKVADRVTRLSVTMATARRSSRKSDRCGFSGSRRSCIHARPRNSLPSPGESAAGRRRRSRHRSPRPRARYFERRSASRNRRTKHRQARQSPFVDIFASLPSRPVPDAAETAIANSKILNKSGVCTAALTGKPEQDAACRKVAYDSSSSRNCFRAPVFAGRHDLLYRFCADVPRVSLGLSFAGATRYPLRIGGAQARRPLGIIKNRRRGETPCSRYSIAARV